MIYSNIALKSLFNTDSKEQPTRVLSDRQRGEKVLVGIGIFHGKVIRVI